MASVYSGPSVVGDGDAGVEDGPGAAKGRCGREKGLHIQDGGEGDEGLVFVALRREAAEGDDDDGGEMHDGRQVAAHAVLERDG